MTGKVTLEFYTRTLNDAQLQRHALRLPLQPPRNRLAAGRDRHAADEQSRRHGLLDLHAGRKTTYWPRTAWTKVRLTMTFNEAPYTIPAGDRLGVALSVERDNTAGRRDPDHVRPPELPDPDRGRHQHADRRGLGGGRRRGDRLPRRADRRQLRDRRRAPRAARRIDRRAALALPRLRRADRRLRQRAGPLLAPAAGARRAAAASRISPRYPLTELGARARSTRRRCSSSGTTPAEVALGLVFVTTLVAITLTDLERRMIPNKILIVAALLGVAIAAVDRSRQPARAGDRRGRGGRPALPRGARLSRAAWASATSSWRR